MIPAWLQWVCFGLGVVSSGAIALVLSDCVRTTLRLRRMAREAARQDFSSDMCPSCARGILQPGLMAVGAMMSAKMSGHVEVLPSREVVAALPSEIEAFKAAMEKSEPEGAEE